VAERTAGSGWTVEDIPSQAGRRAIITGANSGIGYYTALELARKGAHVVMACRHKAKAEAALARLRAQAPGTSTWHRLNRCAHLRRLRWGGSCRWIY
jgi:NAD(P)-dependent dehydrogenase (short-subunit alcohol dehydrogenase family)